jgi:hypothetical protein
MNAFVVSPRYPLGTQVEYVDKDGALNVGTITSVRAYRSQHFRAGAYTLEYYVDPMPSMEHDDQVWIPECHVTDNPRILGPSYE